MLIGTGHAGSGRAGQFAQPAVADGEGKDVTTATPAPIHLRGALCWLLIEAGRSGNRDVAQLG